MQTGKEIIIGIASLPDRVECLKDTITSLVNQCDKIIVGLNNYESIPEFLNHPKIEAHLLDNSLGDAAKFLKIDEYPNAYYFACDDDLIYPSDFTSKLIEKINQYDAIVGLHGVRMVPPVHSYYRNRVVYHGLRALNQDIMVDLVATCSCGFDTSRLVVSLSNFKEANMADIWLADIAKKQFIPAIAIARGDKWVLYNDKMQDKWTIFDEYVKTRKDIKQTEIVRTWYGI